MYIYQELAARAAAGKPVRVGLIGAGKFGSMFLSQIPTTPGLDVAVIADLNPSGAKLSCKNIGWPDDLIEKTQFIDDAMAMMQAGDIDVVVEATGNPVVGLVHAREAIRNGIHIVMVNVEADVLAGGLLAEEARQAGVVYSMAYGDQPALTCELVEWARATGFDVVAAGKGTKYLAEYHASTPDTVWDYYGMTSEQAAAAGMNSQMFNSFLDGTKSALEMAAIANGTGLTPPPDGLMFPPAGMDDLAQVLRPKSDGGQLHHKGQVEVISSEERDGRHVAGDLRWGVYVVFEAPTDYVRACFDEYGLLTDSSGSYSTLWKPFHLIGLELGISVASVALRHESTGAPTGFRGDAVATAKRDLKPGEELDGEGGFTVYGKLMPGEASLAAGGLPIGLAHHVKLKKAVTKDQPVRWSDVEIDETSQAVQVRREMEAMFAGPSVQAAQ